MPPTDAEEAPPTNEAKVTACSAGSCVFNEQGKCGAPTITVGPDGKCEDYSPMGEEEGAPAERQAPPPMPSGSMGAMMGMPTPMGAPAPRRRTVPPPPM